MRASWCRDWQAHEPIVRGDRTLPPGDIRLRTSTDVLGRLPGPDSQSIVWPDDARFPPLFKMKCALGRIGIWRRPPIGHILRVHPADCSRLAGNLITCMLLLALDERRHARQPTSTVASGARRAPAIRPRPPAAGPRALDRFELRR